MGRLLAIARLTIRAAIRSRIFVVLLISLALIAIVLPLTVKSDGTAAGYLQVLLNYALGLASLVLSIATIWIGCGTLCRDIEEKQIQLVATKPVARWQIWAGKWMGVVVLDAVLLVAAGGIVYGLLMWNLRSGKWPPEQIAPLRAEILTARRSVSPDVPKVDEYVRRLVEERMRSGQVPEGVTREELERKIRSLVLADIYAVVQGYGVRWTFSGLPPSGGEADRLELRFRFLCSDVPPSGTVQGEWAFGAPDRSDRYVWRGSSAQNSFQSVTFPASMVEDDGTLVVDYFNLDPYPTTVVFPAEEALELLVPVGSFAGNYARSMLLLWMRMALLAALALACASFATFPVASFTAITFFLLSVSSGFLRTVAGQDVIFGAGGHGATAAPGFLDHLFRVVMNAVLFVVANLQKYNPIGDLSTGRLVGWGWVGRGFLMMLFHGGLLALVGILIFRRRELASVQE